MTDRVEVEEREGRWVVARIVAEARAAPVTFSNPIAAFQFAKALGQHRRRGVDLRHPGRSA